MRSKTGIFLCLLAMGAFIAPLPVLHVCAVDTPHFGSFEFRGSATDICHAHDHEHPDEHAPAQLDQNDRNDVDLWLTHSPELPKTKATHHAGFQFLPDFNNPTVHSVNGAGIRGPPQNRLQLFCTLRI